MLRKYMQDGNIAGFTKMLKVPRRSNPRSQSGCPGKDFFSLGINGIV